ncbi:MAG: trypsin-like peptidase domain-containing protein [Alphaproteobacteria bacterium]|nr:trypsin-like peptidase domain-containing protein [Alphaproteobacteria bacterium]
MLGLLPIALAAPPGLDRTVLVEQGSSSCAGVLVDAHGTVATAYHCVASGGKPKVSLRDGSYSVGRVRAVDRRRDLALLDVPGFANAPFVPIADHLPEPGDDVEVFGHPFGALLPGGFLAGTLRWSVSAGVVAAVGDRALQITAPVNPGNSGGPVVNEGGELVGIVSRRLSGEGMGFAGRADALRPLFEKKPRRLGPLGGTVAAEVVVQANGVAALPLSVGGRLEVALRDRLVLSGSAVAAVGARWQAVRYETSDHEPFEARAALRQRIGRGPWTLRMDGWGGVGVIHSLRAGDPEPVDLDFESRVEPVVGGRISVRNVALDYGVAISDTPFVRMQAVWRWPGVLFVL